MVAFCFARSDVVIPENFGGVCGAVSELLNDYLYIQSCTCPVRSIAPDLFLLRVVCVPLST
jgi:hypothetical protein